jgi:hypothetical protein
MSEVVVKLIKYHPHGSMILFIRVTRNVVVDYMFQANEVAKPYLNEGWQMVYAIVETKVVR